LDGAGDHQHGGIGRDIGEDGGEHEAGHADEEGAALPEAVTDAAA